MAVDINDPNIPIIGTSNSYDPMKEENAYKAIPVLIGRNMTEELLLFGIALVPSEYEFTDENAVNAFMTQVGYMMLKQFYPDRTFVENLSKSTNDGEDVEKLSTVIRVIPQPAGLGVFAVSKVSLNGVEGIPVITVVEMNQEEEGVTESDEDSTS